MPEKFTDDGSGWGFDAPPPPHDPADALEAVADGLSAGDGTPAVLGVRESILIENFTGTIKDAAGRERHYVDGKQVAAPPKDAGPPAKKTPPATPQPAHAPREHVVPKRTPRKETADSAKLVSVAHRRRALAGLKNEAELSTAIDGHNLPDSEPADVVHMVDAAGKPVTEPDLVRKSLRQREQAVAALKTGTSPFTGQPLSDAQKDAYKSVLAQPAHFFEVKTLLVSKQDAVRMSRKAMARKERWMAKYQVSFHTVAVDQRKGGKFSGHKVYVIPNAFGGTVRLDQMQKAPDMASVLKAVKG